MNRMTLCAAGLALASAIGVPGTATAQEQDRIGAFRYWSAFTSQRPEGKVCWAATKPSDKDYSGKDRGDVFLMVTIYPDTGVDTEVSILSGYQYDESRTVQAKIGSGTFSFFAVKDGAWLETRNEERQIVKAMRAGAKAVVTGYADSGGRSTDVFSLLGFTAAYNAAKKACAT